VVALELDYAVILLSNGPGAIAFSVMCSEANRSARWRVIGSGA
jgi:hypothetical protein